MGVSLEPKVQYTIALVVATAVSVLLLLAESAGYGGFVHLYLMWNLFLAWIPFGLALVLRGTLRRKLWSSWEAMILTVAWLAFLPNTFYMISDFIHLAEVDPDQLLMSAIVFMSFIYTSVLLGLSGLYLVHLELRKRLEVWPTWAVVGLALFACSTAIYIGRDLRWNTWDILTQPAGVLFDLSERLFHPAQYSQMLSVIVPFFVLLLSMYVVAWRGAQALRPRDI